MSRDGDGRDIAKLPGHSARHLLWRGVLAAAGNAAIAAGAYPLVPYLQMRMREGRALVTPARDAWTLGREWSVAVGLATARPLGFWGLPGAGGGARGPRPIVVVHGYAMSRTNFLVLGRRLARAGLGPVLGFEYWSLGKVASAARKLGAYIDAVCARTGADAVDVVGHSMGGVVGRYHVALGGGSERVRNLVTIASPHRGTDAAAAGLGMPRRELATGSPLLARLDAAPPPSHTRVTVIWSRADSLVTPVERARIPADEEIVFDDLGHMTMLASRRVARAVSTVLSRDA